MQCTFVNIFSFNVWFGLMFSLPETTNRMFFAVDVVKVLKYGSIMSWGKRLWWHGNLCLSGEVGIVTGTQCRDGRSWSALVHCLDNYTVNVAHWSLISFKASTRILKFFHLSWSWRTQNYWLALSSCCCHNTSDVITCIFHAMKQSRNQYIFCHEKCEKAGVIHIFNMSYFRISCYLKYGNS